MNALASFLVPVDDFSKKNMRNKKLKLKRLSLTNSRIIFIVGFFFSVEKKNQNSLRPAAIKGIFLQRYRLFNASYCRILLLKTFFMDKTDSITSYYNILEIKKFYAVKEL